MPPALGSTLHALWREDARRQRARRDEQASVDLARDLELGVRVGTAAGVVVSVKRKEHSERRGEREPRRIGEKMAYKVPCYR